MPSSFSTRPTPSSVKRHRVRFLVDQEVAGRVLGAVLLLDLLAALQLGNDLVELVVLVDRLLGRARDDQRRARLVDQDRVDLVDDGEVVAVLDHRRQVELHVVAQVVEAELVVGPVGDVGVVGLAPLGIGQAVLDDADRHAEEAVDLTHPIRVAPGEVVVDRDDVRALAGQGVQIDGQRGDQRLALAGPHLGDLALVQDHAADELDVVVPHSRARAGGLADHREGRDQEVVEESCPLRAGRGIPRSCRCSASSESALICGSSALISATLGCSFLTSRSCLLPKTLETTVLSIQALLSKMGSGATAPREG